MFLAWKWCCQAIYEGTFHMCHAGKVSSFFFQAVPLFPKTPFLTFTRETINANPMGGALRGSDPYSHYDLWCSGKAEKVTVVDHIFKFFRLLSQLIAAATAVSTIRSQQQGNKRCNFRYKHALKSSHSEFHANGNILSRIYFFGKN